MENRVPILRAANTGISAIIDSSGRIVKSIPLEERGVVVTDIDTERGQTFYTRYGDWIVILSAAVISVYILVLLNLWRSRRWTT
jgi:apolipoprotein N-acyltransferase